MSRRRRAQKRIILADARFKNLDVAKFINNLMTRGKKSIAERAVYKSLDMLAKKDHEEPLELFLKALSEVKPTVEVKSTRVGGATYQVPVEVKEPRATALAMRWIINAAKNRSENTIVERLSEELADILAGRGTALKKRDETHRMAEANKAFAHFARVSN
ncbi:MAG: 30S ribosomal protein S7 [Pseudomonadota bacterium]